MTTAPGAIVLAAGLGTRMRSARAKVLHELGGEPMIARVIRSLAPLCARAAGSGRRPSGRRRSRRPRALACRASASRSRASPRSAARVTRRDAAWKLSRRSFDGDVLILYGDMPMVRPATLQAFITEHRRAGADVSFISAMLDGAGAYGRVVRDRAGAVAAIVEARDASPAELAIREVNTGVYLARAAVLRAALEGIAPQ